MFTNHLYQSVRTAVKPLKMAQTKKEVQIVPLFFSPLFSLRRIAYSRRGEKRTSASILSGFMNDCQFVKISGNIDGRRRICYNNKI